MRRLLLLALVLPLFLAGCVGGDATGTLAVHVTDAPDAIGDFQHLNVTVEKVTVTSKDGKTTDLEPANGTLDLTTLVQGNATTLAREEIPVGNYTRLDLHVAEAKGVLQDGSEVDVKVPSGRIFLNTAFTVAEGKETDFLFDVQVHQEGNGDYVLKPNADGSGPGLKAPGKAGGKPQG